MRFAALEMIRTLTSTVIVEEAAADRIAQAAKVAESTGEQESAKLHWAMARQQRVRVMELQGRLAALGEHYAATYYAGL